MTTPLPATGRPAWFAGQVLAAADLTAAADADAGLRRLHNRALHGWGIALGLAVSGARGAAEVRVTAGYALDVEGHDVVLDGDVTHPVPPVAQAPGGGPVEYCLTLSRTPDERAVVVGRAGACGTSGAVRRSDAPTIAWLPPSAVRTGLDLVLAVVAVRGCVLAAAPDPSGRRSLRPPVTPYVGAGRADPSRLAWSVRRTTGGSVWAVVADVDTSEAGFGDVPTYLPRITGQRRLDAAAAPDGREALIDGTPVVEEPEPGRFRVAVGLYPGPAPLNPAAVLDDPGFPDLLTGVLGWGVEWIGVQG